MTPAIFSKTCERETLIRLLLKFVMYQE